MNDLRLPPPENGESAPPQSLPSDILIPNTISKRQRRPSVRLGEIGGSKSSKINSIPISSKPLTKSRALTVATRRVRTNWPSQIDGFESAAAAELKSSGSEEDEFAEESARVRVSDGGEEPSEEGFKGWAGGVRNWLDGLGLGRYAPVYEIHEVDDEVLPMLTMEDLRDMGINAVGSRRKMFCAIQKLRKSREL